MSELLLSLWYFFRWVWSNNKVVKHPASIYLFKVKNKILRKKCEECSKLTIKAPEWRQKPRSGDFTFNFNDILHLFSKLFYFWFWTCICFLCIIRFRQDYWTKHFWKIDNVFVVQNIVATISANIYFFKVNNRNTRKKCEICSKLTTKTASMMSLWCLDC